MIKVLIKLLRPYQYVKNGFVLLGIVFFGHYESVPLISAGIAFCGFCMMSSAVYIMNDIFDIEADRLHPVKKKRPLASGAIALKTAKCTGAALALASLATAWAVGIWAFAFILAYALLNFGYSWSWKHQSVLDVFIISAGFMLRILVGTIGIGIPPSSWLLLCGLMMTLFLGFSKRRAELLVLEQTGVAGRGQVRRALDDYSPQMIEQFMSISAACTIMSYGLYTVSVETIARHGTDALVYTVPFVVYGVFRYIFLLHRRGKGSDTARDLYNDPHLLVTVVAWLLTVLAILAWSKL